MTTFYNSKNGRFSTDHLHVKYPDFAGGENVQGAKQPVAIDAGVQRRARTALAPTVNLAVDGRPEQEMESTKYRGVSRLGANDRLAASNSTFAVPVHSVKHGCVVHGIHTQTGSPDCGGHGNKCQGRWDK